MKNKIWNFDPSKAKDEIAKVCHFYRENLKGGHTHNHKRNSLELKLNRSKASRKVTHNYLNRRGF